jgi:hypothetical protein
MAELKGAHIFSAGTHDGSGKGATRTFTESDLDAMCATFNAAQQAGRVPLKFGHNEEQAVTDGKPALGWLSRLWRDGKKLMADFSDIPSSVYSMIRKGLYKFTSIELLRNVEYDGKSFPWMIDAVALLGADPPAVNGLGDLQKLTLSRDSFKFEEVVSFTRQFIEPDEPLTANERQARAAEARRLQGGSEMAELRAENERLKAESIQFKRANVEEAQRQHGEALVAELEGAVRAGHILPATRDQLVRLKKLDVPAEAMKFSREELQLYVRSHDQTELLRGLTRGVAAFSRDPSSSALHGHDMDTLNQAEVVKRIFCKSQGEQCRCVRGAQH